MRPGDDVPGGAPVERADHPGHQPLDRGHQQPHVPAQEPGEMRPLFLVRQARGADPRVSQDRLVRTAYPGGVDTHRRGWRPERSHRRTAARAAGVSMPTSAWSRTAHFERDAANWPPTTHFVRQLPIRNTSCSPSSSPRPGGAV